MDKILEDKEFGQITIRTNGRIRRLGLAVDGGGNVLLRIPFGCDATRALRFLEDHRVWIREVRGRMEKRKSIRQVLFSLGKEIHTLAFDMRLSLYDGKRLVGSFNRGRSVLTVWVPQGTDIEAEQTQTAVHNILISALTVEAKTLLPQWLKRVSERIGLPYNDCRVMRMRTRWGSCSSGKSIHLSSALLLLTPELVELVMIHELCHTVEMNHGPRFHALMAQHTQGREAELEAQLKKCGNIWN